MPVFQIQHGSSALGQQIHAVTKSHLRYICPLRQFEISSDIGPDPSVFSMWIRIRTDLILEGLIRIIHADPDSESKRSYLKIRKYIIIIFLTKVLRIKRTQRENLASSLVLFCF